MSTRQVEKNGVNATPDLTELRSLLVQRFVWRSDRTDERETADLTGWWREPGVVGRLGEALSEPFRDERPTVVVGIQSSGFLLGPLAAASLGVGFVAIRKNPRQFTDSDAWRQRTTPPDHADRHLRLGVRKSLLSPDDLVLAVDDWVATGGQLLAVQALVADAHARWAGASVVVDALTDNGVRRRLGVSALLHERDPR